MTDRKQLSKDISFDINEILRFNHLLNGFSLADMMIKNKIMQR
ncbi:hypothetical protein XNC1_4522 [Xenorhabdus nematophila ATCC 19061]|uniref:Uncharacterized protein n=1 Tax=Xenorhabdus nematophila (strain ATCC 19061 / DSM 3370 / CCUG 14189 / LMG 1036 / NCIMB 9965 / AN6) TaxID=406817 RepID=D3VF87_XENNA|nr:hypothetical protein XNC1_4522 [Xenorhabdus nematophila ATCC 19061]CEK25357.1 hypothetical protein XNC2_4370 [Xenorhabdus nematophila AN6/1]